MPRFDFECPDCHEVFEDVAKDAGKEKRACPKCGAPSSWKPSNAPSFRMFHEGVDVCTGVYHPTQRHYKEYCRQKGYVKVD